MRSIILFTIFALTSGFVFAPSSKAGVFVPMDGIVENGSFETGDLTGWTVVDMFDAGDWVVYSGTMAPGVPLTLLPPPSGDFAVVGEQSDPASTILYQDLEVPQNTQTFCSVIVYYNNEGGQNPNGTAASSFTREIVQADPDLSTGRIFENGDGLNIGIGFPPNQQFRVDIMDPEAPPFDTGSGVLLNIFQTEPGDPEILGYTEIGFDLSPYSGQTVRFRAAFAVDINELAASIDNLQCGPTVQASVPTLTEWGLIAMAGLIGIIGLLAVRRKKATV